MIARPTCIFYNCLGFPLLLILDSQLARCFPALQMKWGRNSLDSVFPISCNYYIHVLPESSLNEEDIENYPLNMMSDFDNFSSFGLYNVWLISLTIV